MGKRKETEGTNPQTIGKWSGFGDLGGRRWGWTAGEVENDHRGGSIFSGGKRSGGAGGPAGREEKEREVGESGRKKGRFELLTKQF